MSTITTHVLDTARGRPAAGVPLRLEQGTGPDSWVERGQAKTDEDGRARTLLSAPLEAGVYRLIFDTGAYFRAQGQETFYPSVTVMFEVRNSGQHHHVPLLLSPFGYSTYRGS
jgi:5-hydroxyisourate hydrolase